MMAVINAWLALAIGFTAVALWRVRRQRRPALPASRPDRTGVVMLRPVDAPTPGERELLRTVPDGLETLVLSPRALDGGRWVSSDPATHNRKLGHLQRALSMIGPKRAVLVVDSDVLVDDALVDALLHALEEGAGLAWAAPGPIANGLTRGLLAESLHSFRVLDAMALGPRPVCGKALALGPAAVEALMKLDDCIGEDLELARVLHDANISVVQAGVAMMPLTEPRLSTVAARFTRWMQVLNAHRPALFPTIPLLFACTPFLIVTGSYLAPALLGLRIALAYQLTGRLSVSWLGAELLLAVCWVRALLVGGRVTWRGRSLRIGRHGVLEGDEP